MTSKKTGNKAPEIIEDKDLDETSGGMLLPAIQKVREAANTTTGITKTGQGTVVFSSASSNNG